MHSGRRPELQGRHLLRLPRHGAHAADSQPRCNLCIPFLYPPEDLESTRMLGARQTEALEETTLRVAQVSFPRRPGRLPSIPGGWGGRKGRVLFTERVALPGFSRGQRGGTSFAASRGPGSLATVPPPGSFRQEANTGGLAGPQPPLAVLELDLQARDEGHRAWKRRGRREVTRVAFGDRSQNSPVDVPGQHVVLVHTNCP